MKQALKEISKGIWEIEQTNGMLVPARVIASRDLLDSLGKDRSLTQLCNVAHLPGIQTASLVMPDAHEGYGFPIGGVAATAWPDGCISPGGIGYDINCGVRLLSTPLKYRDVKGKMQELVKELYRQVPSGMGKGGVLNLNKTQMKKVLQMGARWAVEREMGFEEDLENTESLGCLEEADAGAVSDKAIQRGQNQLGTIGSGNHFAEVDRVEEILAEEEATAFGLSHDQVVILIHTGSRGLGHQTATDYIRLMVGKMQDYNIVLPDRELACVPFSSPEGRKYFAAMCAAANYAWCNRQVITWEIRRVFEEIFGLDHEEVKVVYDVAHNIAKLESYPVDGVERKLIVHRKGATRAFGPGHPALPDKFQQSGQPVLIPGSMGTASWVLAGQEGSREWSFGSCCHGAGRRLSRTAAKKQVDASALIQSLEKQNIYIAAGSHRGVAEEAPLAYKDVEAVVESVEMAGLAKKVARLRPCAVIKG